MKNASSFLLAGITLLVLNEQGNCDEICMAAEACRVKVLEDCMNDGDKCAGRTGKALDICLETKQCKASNIKDNYDFQNCAKEAGCYIQEPGSGETPAFPFPSNQPAPGGASTGTHGGTHGGTSEEATEKTTEESED
jgi:hypothetical protein